MFCIDAFLQMIYKCLKKNTRENTYQPMINMSINGCENIYITSDQERRDNKIEIEGDIGSDKSSMSKNIEHLENTGNKIPL